MTRAPRRRHPFRRALVVLLALVAALVLAAGVPSLYLAHRLSDQVERIDDVFATIPERQRPPRPTSGPAAEAVNILVLGTDRRSEVPTTGTDAEAPAWVPGAQRTDTVMMVHIDADRRGASVVSIPRDSWVDVPGYGMNKVNAAFSFAGPALAVQTVEKLTGVRIDHLAVVDWEGFRQLTDASGGVTVTVPATVHDSARDVTWTAGEHHLDGRAALAYVGQRYGLPAGDLDRTRRQQVFLRSLAEASLQAEMRKSPALVYDLVETLSRHLAIDDEWSTREIAELALSLRDLRTADVLYLTAPVRGFGREGAQSVVYLDQGLGESLWRAVRQDRTEDWAEQHADLVTPAVVN